MIKFILISIHLLCYSFICTCQQIVNFETLKSSGKIPADFIKLSSEKYLSDEKSIDNNESYSRLLLKKKYLLQSNYYLEYILNSGLITFNDSLSLYVKGVAIHLLENQPELKNNLRFYLVKSPEVNAFATDKGIIFITVGLLSQLQSEAQLAWILSHEIIHYKYKHNIESYLENEEILKGKDEFSNTSYSFKLSAIYKYSHENESDADIKGLQEIYSKSDYSFDDVRNTFDVLLYSYLPIEEIDFDKSFFESPQLKFSETYNPKELKPITAIEGYDDSKSTHPNIKKRREAINNTIDKLNKKEGKSFSAFSKEEFYRMRQLARFELCDIYLSSMNYEDAIYTAYSIIKKDSLNNKYLESVISKGLYGLCKFKNAGNYSKVHSKTDEVEGSLFNLVYFFDEISQKELNVLALSNTWNNKNNIPENPDFAPLADDLLKELVFKNKLLPDSFYLSNEIDATSSNLSDSLTEEQISKLDKYEKIKYKRKKQNIARATAGLNYNFALSELIKDESFYTQFEKYKTEYIKQRDGENSNEIISYREKDISKIEKRYGKKLGIDKIVIVNPLVFITKKQKNVNEFDFIASEKLEIRVFDELQKYSEKLGLRINIIDNKLYNENNVDLFNDCSTLSEWVYNRFSKEDTSFCDITSPKIKEVAKKYGTDYFSWILISQNQTNNSQKFGKFLKSSITLFGIPIGFSEFLKTLYRYNVTIVVFDVSKNKLCYEKSFVMEGVKNKTILKSIIYNILFEIKSKPLKK